MLWPRVLLCTGICVVTQLCLGSPSHAEGYEPDQVLVRFVDGAAISCRDSSIALVSGTIVDSVKSSHVYVVQLPDTSVTASVALLSGQACVEYADPNYVGGEVLCTVPNDSLYVEQWYLKNTGTSGAAIGALKGWAYIDSSTDLVVAILDSGCAIDSPDLINNIFLNVAELNGADSLDLDHNGYNHDIHGWDFCYNDTLADDAHGHGTMVASVFGAEGNNGIVMTGVTWRSQILPVKVVDNSGNLTDDARVAQAFDYAVDMGAKIINCSWRTYESAGHGGPQRTVTQTLLNAIRYAKEHGVLIVASAGNEGNDNDVYPTFPATAAHYDSGLDNVMSVAFSDSIDSVDVIRACDASGSKVDYSNYGPNTVHIVAPGCCLAAIEAIHPRGTSCHAGTSLSAPVVSGVAALLWQQNPTWTYLQIKERLMITVDTLSSALHRVISKGRVDIGRALDNVKPSAVSDLAVTQSGNYTQAISWTDTGDDTTCGQASQYHFKYQAGGAITNESQFTNASDVPLYLGPPSPSGTFHCVVVEGLSSCTTYGWALKLEDPNFNIGGLSNSASATTRCSGNPYVFASCNDELMVGSGDGGVGGSNESSARALDPTPASMAAQGVGKVLSGSSTDVNWRAENGLMIGGEGPVTDLLALKLIRPTDGGGYRVRLEAAGGRTIDLSDASLAVVDHGKGSEALATPSGIYIGMSSSITSASVNGRSRTSLYQSGEGAVSDSGETVNLVLSASEGRTLLALDLAAQATTPELSAGTVDVQTQDGQGEWSTAARIAPRRGLDRVAVDVTGAAGVRLQVGRSVFIHSISTLTGANEAKPTWLDLSSILTSGEGVAEAGNINLAPAEHAVLTFAGASQEAETQRSVFLRVTSRSEAAAMYSRASQSGSSAPEVALSLTMRPNPAAGRVAVDYTMARDMNVRIRMYDAAGRLVRTLANGPQTVGSHSLVWDGRNDAGAIVRGGLYFCKMEVGSWASMKKMVFLAQR